MKTYKHWTENDNKKLKGLYPDPSMSVQEIAKQLGRTTNSIKGQAFNLGLRRPYRGTWTETEKQKLRELYATMRYYKEISKHFPGRTKYAIMQRVKILGLKRNSIGKQSPLAIRSEQAAYMAGLIDGEGTVSLRTITRSARKKGFSIASYVAVYNCNTKVVKWIHETTRLGHVRKRCQNSFTRRPVWEWVIRDLVGSACLLRTVLPYLIIKRQQAMLVLDFCENRKLWTTYTDKELAMIDKIRELNRRGI